MASVRILVVQPSELAPPLKLGDWLTDAEAELDVVEPTDLPGNLEEYNGLVVLGGEMSATDDVAYPWLSNVRSLLSHAVTRQVPVLAVCLGAQLLAMATGGQVRSARHGPEAGTLLVAKRDKAAEDRLLGPLALTPDVMQFHSDEISQLPPTAELLASSPKYENQAFRVGECAYGFQFHIETTTDTVLNWAERLPAAAETVRPGQLDVDHLDEFHADMEETWKPVVAEFVRIAATPPEKRRASRSLPMA